MHGMPGLFLCDTFVTIRLIEYQKNPWEGIYGICYGG